VLKSFSSIRSFDHAPWGLVPVPARRRAPIAVQDWFNPDDDAHLQAYDQFQRTGTWPQGFLPAEVGFPPAWHLHLAWRMAERWLRHRTDVRLRAQGAE
jgi:hypothetical protein